MTETPRSIYSISICGRLTLNLHALNNEGTEGNQMLTRQVTVADEYGNLHTVNAISGDMFKHVQAEHLHQIVLADNLPICAPCRLMDPNRIAADKDFIDEVKSMRDREATDVMLKKCAVTDLEGILLTGNRSTPRSSVVEFGWLVGIPEKVHTESFIHLKRVPDAGTQDKTAANNLGQNLFHRPASSGQYAVVVHIEAARIGFNDFSRESPLLADERTKRYKALLKSVLFTLLEPNGAQRNTQLPHIIGFSGVISLSTSACPAPTVSPIAEDYQQQIKQICSAVNEIVGSTEGDKQSVSSVEFGNMSAFTSEIQKLITGYVPYEQKK
jgi:CRISPR-associated protein Cst2